MVDREKDHVGNFCEHLGAAFRAWGEGIEALIPKEFIEKGKEGQREALLALRSLTDMVIEKLSRPSDESASPKTKIETPSDPPSD